MSKGKSSFQVGKCIMASSIIFFGLILILSNFLIHCYMSNGKVATSIVSEDATRAALIKYEEMLQDYIQTETGQVEQFGNMINLVKLTRQEVITKQQILLQALKDKKNIAKGVDSHVKHTDIPGSFHKLTNKESSLRTLSHKKPIPVTENNFIMQPTSGKPQEAVKNSNIISTTDDLFTSQTAVIIFCYNRPEYLRRTLKSLLEVLPPGGEPFLRLFVSQDGAHKGVTNVIEEFKILFKRSSYQLDHLQHSQVGIKGDAYYKLAAHYKFGLNIMFGKESYAAVTVSADRVIILEDDMQLAPDFFDYFASMAPLLDRDTSLLAVSSWNDHGIGRFVSDPTVVYRSDFFPGLGWMMPKRIWDELGDIWPIAYWDDWMREPARRKERQIIRPEMCRTYTFGEAGGASAGQYFAKYLKPIKLNQEKVNWKKTDLSYLSASTFENMFLRKVKVAKIIKISDLGKYEHNSENYGDLRINYANEKQYEMLSKQIGIINDIKAHVPRGAYKGIVPLRLTQSNANLFLTPSSL